MDSLCGRGGEEEGTFSSNSQPICDHQKPSYGECGSRGVSVCRWWKRWLLTHSVGSPWCRCRHV